MNKRIFISAMCIAMSVFGFLQITESNQNMDQSLIELNSVAVANAEDAPAVCYYAPGYFCNTPDGILWYNVRFK